MKLKLTDFVMSRAKQLLRLSDQEHEAAGALIRHSAVRAAEKCAKIGRNNDVQFNKSLKEFLAFFSVVTVNEFGLRSGRKSDEELRLIYEALLKAIGDGPEPDKSQLSHQLTIRALITYKRSGFDHWFYGYWNADLAGMRVSQEDLQELESKQIQGPTGDYCRDASFILLVRICRLGNAQGIIPSTPVIMSYDSVIRDEVDCFVRGLQQILK